MFVFIIKEHWTFSDILEAFPEHVYILVVTNLCYKCVDMAEDVDSEKFLLGCLLTFVGGAVSSQSKL